MTHILLLGAGFSRNWGGWLGSEVFEYLLGCREIIDDVDLQSRLWRHKDGGGFEAALEELQIETGGTGDRTRLEKLEIAIYRMFSDMEKGFRNGQGQIFEFEFIPTTSLVKEFLTGFDAIFTLNQDLLLERHYFTTGLTLIRNQRTWGGYVLPGMRPVPDPSAPFTGEVEVPTYAPSGDYTVGDHSQPYYKLHGSSNWRDADKRLIVALGGDKIGTIRANDVLRHAMDQFKAQLTSINCRLMIIGYGFLDQHINHALAQVVAAGRGLKIFGSSAKLVGKFC